MISIEAAREGFVLAFGRRRILVHSKKRPCVELGEAPPDAGGGRNPLRPRLKGSFRVLRGFRVLEASSEAALIDFEEKLRMRIRIEGGRLSFSFSAENPALPLRLRFQAFPDERIYGAGARAALLDLKGRKLTLWVGEEGWGSESSSRNTARRREDSGGGKLRTGSGSCPIPAFISSRNYWCALDTESPVELDFRHPSSSILMSWELPRQLIIGEGKDPPALLGDLSEALGRQAAPPAWAFDGIWLGLGGKGAEIEAGLEEALAAGIRVAMVSTAEGGLGLAPEPELRAAISRCRARGIRFMGRTAPILRPGSPAYADASEAGYLVRDADRKDYLFATEGGAAALVDLTNPAAFDWTKALIARDLLAAGFSGWSAELPLGLPLDASLHTKEAGLRLHNAWPLLWARANREAIEEAGLEGEILFVMRSGWLGSSRFLPIVGLGEGSGERRGSEGLARLVRSALSLGMSGLGFGLGEVRYPLGRSPSAKVRERFFRRLELATFGPFLRVGERGAGASLAPDPEILAFLARMSEIYASLKPYHAAVAEDYREGGYPPLRHPYFHYETEAELHRWPLQFLYGRDLIIAPVLGAKRELAELLLPKDEWIHLWSSRQFRGGVVTVEAPLGFPAVFYRASSTFASLFDAIRRNAPRI